jgi:flavodoxin
MKNVLIIYDTQFGNTKQLAEEIAKGILENSDFICKVERGDGLENEDISKYDAVLFGGPTRAFRATRGALEAIKKAGQRGLDGKVVTTFGSYLMGNQSRGVKAMDKLLKKVAIDAKVINPGFSGKVDGIRGPLNENAIPAAHQFGRTIGQEITDNSSRE